MATTQTLGTRLVKALKILAAHHKKEHAAAETARAKIRSAVEKRIVQHAAKWLGVPASMIEVKNVENPNRAYHTIRVSVCFANGTTVNQDLECYRDNRPARALAVEYYSVQSYPSHLTPCAFQDYLSTQSVNAFKTFFRSRYDKDANHEALTDADMLALAKEWVALKAACSIN